MLLSSPKKSLLRKIGPDKRRVLTRIYGDDGGGRELLILFCPKGKLLTVVGANFSFALGGGKGNLTYKG